jgi:hypothetical protein
MDESARIASFDQTPPERGVTPADGKEWAKYLVWAVLVGCALFLSWISWRLIRKKDSGA